jgi:hypothetical protein
VSECYRLRDGRAPGQLGSNDSDHVGSGDEDYTRAGVGVTEVLIAQEKRLATHYVWHRLDDSLYLGFILIRVTYYGTLGGEEVKGKMLKCPERAYLLINAF